MKHSAYGLTLSVGELIAELEKLPKEAPVFTEGCDCWGTAKDVRVTGSDEHTGVIIER